MKLGKDDYRALGERRRVRLVEELAQAHVDAGVYGRGWLSVDADGYVTRIDPKAVIITLAGVEWKNTISVRGAVPSLGGRIDNLPREDAE